MVGVVDRHASQDDRVPPMQVLWLASADKRTNGSWQFAIIIIVNSKAFRPCRMMA